MYSRSHLLFIAIVHRFFLLASIQVFNGDETMDRYIERCWRIIQRTAAKRDLEITVVHACLGHFMKNVKRNASKVLGKKQVRTIDIKQLNERHEYLKKQKRFILFFFRASFGPHLVCSSWHYLLIVMHWMK